MLNYNSETGIFTWKVNRGCIKKGNIAGHIAGHGYIGIRVKYKLYYAHRLAWLYVYGFIPENYLDHINRNRSDNRIENLREASVQCNARNCKVKKTNTSGITGVSWYKRDKKWLVGIKINGRRINLGRFKTKKEAAKARWDGEKKYGFPNCNTISSAYQYLQKSKGIF